MHAMRGVVRGVGAAAVALAVASTACGGDGAPTLSAPSQPTSVTLSFTNLRALDPATEGSYQAWLVTGGQPTSLGRFPGASSVTLPVISKIANSAEVWITVEPPGDSDDQPSAERLLRGTFNGATA